MSVIAQSGFQSLLGLNIRIWRLCLRSGDRCSKSRSTVIERRLFPVRRSKQFWRSHCCMCERLRKTTSGLGSTQTFVAVATNDRDADDAAIHCTATLAG